jgi:hypothetical protein
MLKHLWARLGLTARVINLESRKDRQLLAMKHAGEIGLPIEFYFAKPVSNGIRGCFESHQNVCRQALERGEKRVLILEDDFLPTKSLFTQVGIKALSEAIEFALSSESWNIIYLGVIPNVWTKSSERIGQHLFKIFPYAQTHAMILSESYMKEVVSWKFTGLAYDWMHRKTERVFAIYPQAFTQAESISNITSSRTFQIGIPLTIIDSLSNAANWYALHVGEKLSLVLFMITIFVLMIYGRK